MMVWKRNEEEERTIIENNGMKRKLPDSEKWRSLKGKYSEEEMNEENNQLIYRRRKKNENER